METPDERLAEGDSGLLPPVNAASRKVLRYVNSELVLSKDHGTFQVNEKMALMGKYTRTLGFYVADVGAFPTIHLS